MERLSKTTKRVFDAFNIAEDSPDKLVMKKLEYGFCVEINLKKTRGDWWFRLQIKAASTTILDQCGNEEIIQSTLESTEMPHYIQTAEDTAKANAIIVLSHTAMQRYLGLFDYLSKNGFKIQIDVDQNERAELRSANGSFNLTLDVDGRLNISTKDGSSQYLARPTTPFYEAVLAFLNDNAKQNPLLNTQLRRIIDRIISITTTMIKPDEAEH